MQLKRMDKGGLKERRRKLSDDNASTAEEMTSGGVRVETTSSTTTLSHPKMTTSSRQSNRRRNLERSSTPMLEMIEQQPTVVRSDDDKLSGDTSDVDDTLSQGSMETVSDDTLGKGGLMAAADALSTSTSLDSSDYTASDSSSKYQKLHPKTLFKTNEKSKELDVEKYMASREMTPFQERMNAVTVMPGAFYCIMFLLSGAWLSEYFVEEHGYELPNTNNGAAVFDGSQCLSLSWMPHFHALPPLPLVAAALGIILHAPFSFIYHWKYAHRLPAGLPRTTHWSRRMDQAMIHFCSGCMAYATSGRWDFFVANALFNADCIYRQFMQRVRPRRNQVRIFISVVAYTIPLLRRGDLMLFSKIWFLFTISGWLFSQYPIGGWSHSVFHIVMAFVPPLLMTAAVELPASQEQLKVAAQCAVMAKESLVS